MTPRIITTLLLVIAAIAATGCGADEETKPSIPALESSPRAFTSTLSITASKTFSRGPKRVPTSTWTTIPFLYFVDLLPRRIVAVLRRLRSWSATIGE